LHAEKKKKKGDADSFSSLENCPRPLFFSAVDVAKAEMQRAEVKLQYLQVRAPFDGVVLERRINVGDHVGPAVAGESAPLFVVARVDLVRIVVQVAESDVLRVKQGAHATIRLPALGDQVVEGKVTRVAGSIDPKTGTFRVEIDLPNPDQRLMPGMFARVSIRAGDAQKEESSTELDALKKARLQAAQKAYQQAINGMDQTKRSGNMLIVLAKPEEVYSWSVRWLRAQQDVNSTRENQVAALEAHLKRMKEVQPRAAAMEQAGLATVLEVAAAEFYRTEAELWLAQEKAKK
jgi:hypothetical protein